ncbi:hypothetical protein V6D40_01285 [Corynebacterium sp. Q4381]|uniref:hypothetical protein n=1 Tax=Corynebacterium sp. Marseille-Q4381 TaxID=3121597 RepID=UPI002FE69D51
MSATVLIMPGSPALVPELAPADEASARLLAAAREAARAHRGPVDIVTTLDEASYTAHTGSFHAWGAPHVTVGGGNYLGELLARYVAGDREYRETREHVEPLDPDALTIVVVDGPAGLTARAPLALQPGAQATHEGLERFIAGGALGGLEGGVDKQLLWRELAQLTPKRAELIASDATLGVGRYVGVWQW